MIKISYVRDTGRELCAFCILFLAVMRLLMLSAPPPDDPYEAFRGKEVSFEGTVAKKEQKKDKTVIYLEDTVQVSGGTIGAGYDQQEIKEYTSEKKTGKTPGLMVYIREGEIPAFGVRIRVTGKLSLFDAASNPGEFDLQRYYLYKGYGACFYYPDILVVNEDKDILREKLWTLRLYLEDIYSYVMDEADAGVLRAMVLGDKSELERDVKELYRMSGIAHILAISGLHISIIGMGLYRLLRRFTLPVAPSAVLSVMIMTAYAMMTGAGTSTIRAVTMFFISVLADVLRASYDLPTALALSAFITVLMEPYELLLSGFMMSYTAVAGIAIFYPTVKQKIRIEDRLLRKVSNAVFGCICVTAFTMPLIASQYYEVPVYSVFINILVIPLMTVLMIAGLITLACGVISPAFAAIPGYICHLILGFYEALCLFFSKLPYSNYICGAPSVLQIVLCYSAFCIVIIFGKKMKLFLRVLMIPLGLAILFFRLPSGFELTMLDVGQGDGIYLSYGNVTCMTDCGSTSDKGLYEYTLLPFLKYKGCRKVDMWFVTHPDSDHLSALKEMLESDDCGGIKIDKLILPEAAGADVDFTELIQLAGNHDIEVEWISAGDVISFSGEKDSEGNTVIKEEGITGSGKTPEKEKGRAEEGKTPEEEKGRAEEGKTPEEEKGRADRGNASDRIYSEREELKITCLHPVSGYEASDVNEYSIIYEVSLGDFSGIFTGDATEASEKAVLTALKDENAYGDFEGYGKSEGYGNYDIQGKHGRYTLLKAGHHGSHTSNSEEWIDYLSPEIVFISCGFNNRYGHPHEDVLERFEAHACEIYRTDLQGAVTIRLSNAGVEVKPFCE